MSVEAAIVALIEPIVPRVYADVAPPGTAAPYATYQQVGGQAISYLGREVPSIKNGRFQVNVWAPTRKAASTLALQIEAAFITSAAFQAEVLGAASSDYEQSTQLYGTRQDFSVWSTR